MEENNKLYMAIGSARLLDVRVIVDGQEVYSGMIEDAPEEIKRLRYSNVEIKDKFTYYVNSVLN